MYETETLHLHSSIERCWICKDKLKERYRKKGKLIQTLQGEKYIVSHVYSCERKECRELKVTVEPEEERRIVLKHCSIGLDVTLEIGRLRQKEYKTQVEIQKELKNKYGIEISEREIGYQNQMYLTLVNMEIKRENGREWKKLKELKGLVLAVDGIKPDVGDNVLFIVREIQTGYVLGSRLLEYTSANELAKLIQSVKEMPFEILGVVSDSESLVLQAIKQVLPEVPHQLCQYHFLKQLGKKVKTEDGKLKKKILTSMLELRRKANNIDQLIARNNQEKKEVELLQKYFLAIHTVLMTKSCYPLKPAGVTIYKKLGEIACSLENTIRFFPSQQLSELLHFLRSQSIFYQEAKDLDKIFSIIKKVASITKKSYPSEDVAKTKLLTYANSLRDDSGSIVSLWISYFKKMLPKWLPHLFRYISFPLLPNTNNDLEAYNLKIKRTYRKISGRKNSHTFLLSSGVPISYLLSSDTEFSTSSFLSFSYDDIVSERKELFQSSKKSDIYAIKHHLQDFLFALEEFSSS